QEAILLETEIDESGLHAGKDVAHPPEIDVSVQRARRVALHPQLDERVVLDQGDAALAREAVDQEAAAQGGSLRALS
ncbi:MAG TPA: hypothetical protein VGQ67_10745, partial [Candidatus Polarisedimenticolia bacterium]|nr:hypothetical protein [Candidatus Polarisedimenticolia bacterium]